MDNASDEQLIAQYLRGREASLEILVRRYLPLVYGFSRRYTGDSDNASDIAQETFVKAWRNLKKFDRKRSFRSWIFTIAKNTALDWLKKKEAIPFSSFEASMEENFLYDIADQSPVPSVALDRKLEAANLDAVLEKLPDNYRRVVAMRHKQELTFREIAVTLRAPLNTVKSRYRRALLMLRNHISGSEGAA